MVAKVLRFADTPYYLTRSKHVKEKTCGTKVCRFYVL